MTTPETAPETAPAQTRQQPAKRGLFITSTGTEIGKTYVTAALCHQLTNAGRPVKALKPLISGIDANDMRGTDTAIIAQACGLPLIDATYQAISPYRFKAPLAPAMAAALEGKTLDYQALLHSCKQAFSPDHTVIIEGVGGSFVPLVGATVVADWIKDLGLDSILVVGSYLGTLSHTLSCLEAMQHRGLSVKAIVVSESPAQPDDAPDFDATCAQIHALTQVPVIKFARSAKATGWQSAPDLTHLVASL